METSVALSLLVQPWPLIVYKLGLKESYLYRVHGPQLDIHNIVAYDVQVENSIIVSFS
jgi:hypothetical protein